MNKPLSLYLHIPFCLSKCAYCDFYSLSDTALMQAYVSSLCRALRAAARSLDLCTVDTVFFGGGTPSLLGAGEMEAIFSALSAFALSSDCEISMEVNPATATAETLAAYRSIGVNRLSIGMQSANDAELCLLSRRHNAAETRACVEAARRAGFENFSLDLMYGLPDQREEDLKNSLEVALSYGPKHLSLYALTLSEDVPLYALRERMPEEERQADFYRMICRRAEECGLMQYEISNFAKEGCSCRHNLRYWTRGEYLGFGPAAASFYRNRRYTERASLCAFMEKTESLLESLLSQEPMDEDECLSEEILLRLRLAQGLLLSSVLPKLKDARAFLSEADRLAAHGFCTRTPDCLKLTQNGFFVSNEIIARLLLAAGL